MYYSLIIKESNQSIRFCHPTNLLNLFNSSLIHVEKVENSQIMCKTKGNICQLRYQCQFSNVNDENP